MSFPIKKVEPTAIHQEFRNDMIALLTKHSGALPADAMLALASHLVGQLVAMQDQRKLTPAMAMELVAANIQAGNAEVIQGLQTPQGRS